MSVGPYTTTFWMSARMSIKSYYLVPVIWIMAIGFPMIPLLPFIVAARTWAVMAALGVIYVLQVVGLAVLLLPIPVLLGWLYNRNAGGTTTTLGLEGTVDVSPIRTTEVFWREVRRIRSWSGDVFIQSSRKGIVVPREAFGSREKSEEFLARAKALKENATNRVAAK